jgi:AcrR family transcriptional regulator
MESSSTVAWKRGKGRPRGQSKQEIADRLLAAAERLIREQGHLKATERKIAAAAGVSVSLIHYYFNDKDGLLFSVIDNWVSHFSATLDQINTEILHTEGNPTRIIIGSLVEIYYSKPWLYRLMISEIMQKDSTIREMFLNRYGSRVRTELQRMLDGLTAAGVYRHQVNTGYVAMSMYSTIIGPLALTLLSDPKGIRLEELRGDGWIDYLTDLFDRQLRQDARSSSDIRSRTKATALTQKP